MVNGKKKDYLGMLKIRGTIRRESVIESQSDILVERINIIEISQSVYDLLLGRHFYLNVILSNFGDTFNNQIRISVRQKQQHVLLSQNIFCGG